MSSTIKTEYGSWESLSSKILVDERSYYIYLPEVFILDKERSELILPLTYLLFKRGIDNTIICSLSYITKQCGYKYERKRDNGSFIDKIKQLQELGYIEVNNKFYSNPYDFYEIKFNYNLIKKLLSEEYFIILYKDEFQKIIDYKVNVQKRLDVGNLLKTFCYFKKIINKRNNEFSNVEEGMTLQERKINPYKIEAFDDYYYKLSDKLNMTDKTFSKMVVILKELNLIYYEKLPRIKYSKNGKVEWRTITTIFSLTNKRELHNKNIYLLAEGEKYYKAEINNKIKALNDYDNTANKSKRKVVKTDEQ
jgi:hypothetical protein